MRSDSRGGSKKGAADAQPAAAPIMPAAAKVAAADRPPPEQALGAILRRAREARGLEIAQLAATAGAGVASLLSWEAGITVPRLDLLTRHGGVVGLDLSDLAAAVAPAAPDRSRYHRFGEVFAAARRRRKLTVAAVARSVGVGVTTVLGWEEGRSLPQNRRLPQLVRRLGLHLGEVDALLGAPAAPEEPAEELVADGGEPPRTRRFDHLRIYLVSLRGSAGDRPQRAAITPRREHRSATPASECAGTANPGACACVELRREVRAKGTSLESVSTGGSPNAHLGEHHP